jgi:hypothetical protein
MYEIVHQKARGTPETKAIYFVSLKKGGVLMRVKGGVLSPMPPCGYIMPPQFYPKLKSLASLIHTNDKTLNVCLT